MNTETLIQFFKRKLDNISDLRKLKSPGDQAFITWWNTVLSTCERMGQSYKQKADNIQYYPSIVIGDDDTIWIDAYQRGLNEAESFIKSTIEDLETWGYGSDDNDKGHETIDHSLDNKVILNLTISQQQAQQITQSINLSQYDLEVQEKVRELLDELKKESKNKTKIIDVVKWLADKGVDALIAILLASSHLA